MPLRPLRLENSRPAPWKQLSSIQGLTTRLSRILPSRIIELVAIGIWRIRGSSPLRSLRTGRLT